MKEGYFDGNRRFLVGGGLLAAAASFYMAAVGRGALNGCGSDAIVTKLGTEFQALIRIGNSYLADLEKAGLLGTLGEDSLDIREVDDAATIQRRLLQVRRNAQMEFARAETVSCDGWVLAKSEARLCAVLAARARRFQIS